MTQDKKNDNLTINGISLFVSIIAICFSVNALCSKHALNDTIVITSFSILVTVLIGWQIGQIINIGKIKNEIEENKKEISNKVKYLKNIEDIVLELGCNYAMDMILTSQYYKKKAEEEKKANKDNHVGISRDRFPTINDKYYYFEARVYNEAADSASLIAILKIDILNKKIIEIDVASDKETKVD